MKKHFLFKMVVIVLFFIAGNKNVFSQMQYTFAYVVEYKENQNSDAVVFFMCRIGIDDDAGNIDLDLYKLPNDESLVDNQTKIDRYLNSSENIYVKINLSDSTESGMSIIFKKVMIDGNIITGTTARATLNDDALTITIGMGKDHRFIMIVPM